MIAFISKNEWRRPLAAFVLNRQRSKLHHLARKTKGYRGMRTKWTFTGVYFMTLWKSQEDLDEFLNLPAVKSIFRQRNSNAEIHTLSLSAINFIPWREVIVLMERNSLRWSNY